MATTLVQKLKIKEGYSLLTLHAPDDFAKTLAPLPKAVTFTTSAKEFDQVHWFVKNKAQLEKELNKVLKLVKPGIGLFIYYPKKTSSIQTDLTRDNGWDRLMQHSDRLTWLNLISFDDTWSIFCFRGQNEDDKKKAAKPKVEREIFNWVNPATKEVRIPDELAAALKKHKKLSDIFYNLAYSHKKEYVEWIVSAKKEETRQKRIEGTIERLEKGWKNPANN